MGRLVVVLALAALVAASLARAGDAPDPRLDAVATELAGHPVSVWCETSDEEWVALAAPLPPERVLGKARVGGSKITLAPVVCLSLRHALRADEPAEWRMNVGTALRVLLHESAHARGIADEHEANCFAVGLMRRYLISLIGIPERVHAHKIVRKRVRAKVKGQWVRVVVRVRVCVVVPNPRLKRLVWREKLATGCW